MWVRFLPGTQNKKRKNKLRKRIRNRDLRKKTKSKRKTNVKSKNTGLIKTNSKLFTNYTCYQFFHKKEKRWYIKYINNDTNKSRTITRAKFRMECKLNRFLTYDEEVDHIDENKLNDNIDNLQILTKTQNIKKHFKIKKENK